MTILETSQSAPREVTADAVVIGVLEDPGGPVLAPGAEDIDAAMGGMLAATLAALGATGKPEELTRVASGGRLQAPVVAAVGLGP
ncbi:MAG TPA: leucyl aminopeptidase, partial [Actinobacteria bacterium]|nr:leucyl aminopeptidase [Actinomycetota bacterium]